MKDDSKQHRACRSEKLWLGRVAMLLIKTGILWLCKNGCFNSIKRVGYTTLKNMDLRVCDITCQHVHVCGLKIIGNYQDFHFIARVLST